MIFVFDFGLREALNLCGGVQPMKKNSLVR